MPEFQAVQCFKCRTFQVQQVSKAARGGNKFGCRMCSEKQSIRKVYAVGAAKDVRAVVVRLSSLQGEHTQALACAALNTNTPSFHSSWGGAPGADEAQGSEQHQGRSGPSGDCISYPSGSRPPARGAGSVNWGEFLEDADQQGHQDRNDFEEASGMDGWDQGGALYVTALPESNRKRPRREKSRPAAVAAAAAEDGGPGGAEATGGAPTRDHQGWRSLSWTKPAPPPRFPVQDTARGNIIGGGGSRGPPFSCGSSGAHQQSVREQQQHTGTASAPMPSIRAPCYAHRHQEHSRDRFGNGMGRPSSSSSAAAAAAASRPPVSRPSVQPRSLEPSVARNAQQMHVGNHSAASARQAAGSMGSRWDEFVDEEDEEEYVGRGGGGGVGGRLHTCYPPPLTPFSTLPPPPCPPSPTLPPFLPPSLWSPHLLPGIQGA